MPDFFPDHLVQEAKVAAAWLARGAAIKVGDESISRVTELGVQAILDTPKHNEQRALEQGCIRHLRTGDNSGVYRAYEQGWRDGREWQVPCDTCGGLKRVRVEGFGHVTCPDCAELVHMWDDGKALCGIQGVVGSVSKEEGDVTCSMCLHKLCAPSESDMRMARWIGRAISYLRTGARSTERAADRDELLREADQIWTDKEDDWDALVLKEAERARCVGCGRTKNHLMTEGHAPGCPHMQHGCPDCGKEAAVIALGGGRYRCPPCNREWHEDTA